jgi:diadenosine tetraphosphate (Ap4A) HIT family hydrolase
MTGLSLDPRLERDAAFACDLPLCQVRIMNDERWPWLVLVPRVEGASELTDLSVEQRAALMEEIIQADEAVLALGATFGRLPEKTNVAALGNVVAQLHVHVIGRRADDPAWPRPVWNEGTPSPYGRELALAIGAVCSALGVPEGRGGAADG